MRMAVPALCLLSGCTVVNGPVAVAPPPDVQIAPEIAPITTPLIASDEVVPAGVRSDVLWRRLGRARGARGFLPTPHAGIAGAAVSLRRNSPTAPPPVSVNMNGTGQGAECRKPLRFVVP